MLLGLLGVLLIISCIITGSVLTIFLAARLFLLVRSGGARAGVTEWTQETKARLYKAQTDDSHDSAPKAEQEQDKVHDDDDRYSNVSVGSTVVVPSATDGGASGKDLAIKQETE